MTASRLPAADRRAAILAAAKRVGWSSLTREAVADAAGVSPGLVSYYFGSMDELRDEMMSAAVADSDVAVIAAGIAAGHPAAQAAPLDLRRAAALSLVG